MDERFGMVPVRVLGLPISKPALRLLIAMSAHAGANRLCWASQATLADECGWFYRPKARPDEVSPDRRSVRSYVQELLEHELIRPAGRHVRGDGAWTLAYEVAPYRDGGNLPATRDGGNLPASLLNAMAGIQRTDGGKTDDTMAVGSQHKEILEQRKETEETCLSGEHPPSDWCDKCRPSNA